MSLAHLSLFTGIGGMDLGLERAGFTTIGQVELDPFCRSVLARHWPDVPRHDDVRTAVPWWNSRIRPRIDLLSGGFPCQPFSVAGKMLGIGDERWGWPWMYEVIKGVRPRYVLIENVPRLLADTEAFATVCADLSHLGFDLEWSVLSACAMGAPHVRKRLFVVAYATGQFRPSWLAQELSHDGRQAEIWGNRDGEHALGRPAIRMETPARTDRMAYGSALRMVAAGGNAVVPQIAEFIGRAIMARGDGE